MPYHRSAKTPEGDVKAQNRVRLIVMPSGNVVNGVAGHSYAETLAQNGVSLCTECGGMGTCGKCVVRFPSDAPDPSPAGRRFLSAQALDDGWRLACQHPVKDGTQIEIPSETRQLESKAAFEFDVARLSLNPGISAVAMNLAPPTRDDPLAGMDALLTALGEHLSLSLAALRGLADRPRGAVRRVQVIKGNGRVLDVRSGEGVVLGAAIDVGTTTLAVYLYDLVTGRRLGSSAGYNPQRAFGADVISRIGRVRERSDDGLAELHETLIEGLNERLQEACTAADADPRAIYRAVVVGNPTMMHLMIGVSPVGIDHVPYVSVFLRSAQFQASEEGLCMHPSGDVLLLPGISSYVGSDIVAGLLATSLGQSGEPELLVDIGTNGEIVLAVDDRLISCSTAAGPAFEGAAIRQGMTAVSGAIEDVSIRDGSVTASVIGGGDARGLCGTGLIGAIDECRIAGCIDSTGRMVDDACDPANRIEGEGRDRAFMLTDGDAPVRLYQQDVREFQLGKAAIRAGIDTLLGRMGIGASDLARLYVAGAFGTHLRPQRAFRTGLLPTIDEGRIRAVGNTAVQGAVFVLLDRRMQAEAEELVKRAEYVELSSDAGFSERYLDHVSFPSA